MNIKLISYPPPMLDATFSELADTLGWGEHEHRTRAAYNAILALDGIFPADRERVLSLLAGLVRGNLFEPPAFIDRADVLPG